MGAVSWRWNRNRFRFEALVDTDCDLFVIFHKVGGRWSKGGGKSFWTATVETERNEHRKFATADEGKAFAVAEFRRRFR